MSLRSLISLSELPLSKLFSFSAPVWFFFERRLESGLNEVKKGCLKTDTHPRRLPHPQHPQAIALAPMTLSHRSATAATVSHGAFPKDTVKDPLVASSTLDRAIGIRMTSNQVSW
jgi:hypothetical protein